MPDATTDAPSEGSTGTDAMSDAASDGDVWVAEAGPDSSETGPEAGPDAGEAGHEAGEAGPDAGEAGPEAGEGNIIIADQFNNRVIEIDRQGHIVWQFGNGNAKPGPMSVVGPNDVERLPNGQTLISGTGVPAAAAGTSTGDPACDAVDAGAAGCPDNRVLLVGADGGISWVYGANGELNAPVFAAMTANGHVLITDQGNNRIVEVAADGGVAWQFGPLPDGGSLLNNPNSAQRLPSGDTLIADEGANRVIQVQGDGGIGWQYGLTPDGGAVLSAPAFASRLPSGNTLIDDSGHNRVLEVDTQGTVVWSYVTTSRYAADAGSANPTPTRAVRLANGNTLISDQFNHQVFEIDHASPPNVVFSFGQLNVAGNGAGQLNAPYDAKLVGDFTGLTIPPQ
ncbi:MAG TPA: hypothetical protein VGY54_24475 [Polyangiaceae bacterium]|jgi:hypothetical protein|nr:hypothetical protein [Polyangiaceae bacterium]